MKNKGRPPLHHKDKSHGGCLEEAGSIVRSTFMTACVVFVLAMSGSAWALQQEPSGLNFPFDFPEFPGEALIGSIEQEVELIYNAAAGSDAQITVRVEDLSELPPGLIIFVDVKAASVPPFCGSPAPGGPFPLDENPTVIIESIASGSEDCDTFPDGALLTYTVSVDNWASFRGRDTPYQFNLVYEMTP